MIINGINSGSIQEVEILSDQESEKVRKIVLSLKNKWTPRHLKYPVYSLGAVNYFDIPEHRNPPYMKYAKECNPILWKNLDWMYKILKDKLSIILGRPVGFNHNIALPGFHIFEFHDVFRKPESVTHHEFFRRRDNPSTYPGVPIHADTSYLLINWDLDTDLNNPLSFTVGIDLPETGSGLKVWNLRLNETFNHSEDEILSLIQSRTSKLYCYKPGRLILHDGKSYHQAWSGEDIKPGEMRMTLQGHGIFTKGQWILYW